MEKSKGFNTQHLASAWFGDSGLIIKRKKTIKKQNKNDILLDSCSDIEGTENINFKILKLTCLVQNFVFSTN